MTTHYDIVTIGSATVDYFADSDSEMITIETRTSTEELLAFPHGGKILVNELNITTGGGGTNTAVAFSRLGFRTGFLGKLGDDPAADVVLDKLADEHIDFLGGREGQTGISFILNSIEDDRTILVYKGANNFLEKSDVAEFESPWIYISSMMDTSFETVIDLVSRNDFKVAFNPSSYQADMGYAKLKALIDRVSILIMNREEACKYLDRDPHKQRDVTGLLEEMSIIEGQTLVITDAENGAWVKTGDTVWHGDVTGNLVIAETTGSGDAFGSTFTGCIMRGLPPDQALNYAMTNAESVIRWQGAKEKLLSWDELEELAAKSGRKIEESKAQGPSDQV